MQPESNPFSTRFIRAGAIPFLCGEHTNAETVLRRFKKNNWLAQIVGPHGAGKTTLVRALEPQLQTRFAVIKYLTIRKTANRLTLDARFSRVGNEDCRLPNLLVVDGAESLTRLHRWLLKQWCKTNGTGLLVTAHQPLRRLPTIATLRPNSRTFLTICEWLQRSAQNELDHRACLGALKTANGNFREAFLALYDQFEHQRSRKRKGSGGSREVATRVPSRCSARSGFVLSTTFGA